MDSLRSFEKEVETYFLLHLPMADKKKGIFFENLAIRIWSPKDVCKMQKNCQPLIVLARLQCLN